ncbi:carbohydrate binding domain-containing protein [Aureibaculum sp. A20]|uniref:Carbohydrate binding domain-containing protein n=1 Tax=Aureibaculum flavum TaxID=2795986 RepID=A0ABS0WNJ9_9FLAO|nr:carbohydrate binding domain-containing protein [Aureibaculum flavum]MBJ2173519.1 carbohydrate binding domain-containing protein [Aureibaculum flavum]
MKQTTNISRFKFASLLVALVFVTLLSSCDNDDEPLSDLSRVSMKTLPQVNYVLGTALDLSDMVITLDKGGENIDIPFASFEQEDITTEPENGKILEFSDKSVTIKLGTSGKGLIQTINVTNEVTEIKLKNEPIKDYVSGKKLDLSNMVVTLVYENGDEEDFDYEDIKEEITTVPAHGDIVSGNDKEVLITYTSTGVEVVQELNVIRFAPVKGVIVTGPAKSEYVVGERLELSGTVIHYTLLDNSEVDVAFEEFEAFKLTATPANDEQLNASITEVKVRHVSGIEVKIPITVNPLDIVGMDIETNPEKLVYEDGETIDLKGLSVKLSVSGSDDLIVLFDQFDFYGISTNPANGDVYSNGTSEIVISYPGLADTISIPLGSEILYESDFSTGFDGWVLNQNGGGSANAYEENRTMVIKDIVPGANYWDVQFYKPNLTLVNGGNYKLTVVLKAYPSQGDFTFTLSVGDGDGRDGYQPYDGGGSIYLVDSEFSTYEKTFTMTKSDTPMARILLDIGNQTNGIIIQSVKFEKI